MDLHVTKDGLIGKWDSYEYHLFLILFFGHMHTPKMKRRENLRINSTIVGMDSARSYTSKLTKTTAAYMLKAEDEHATMENGLFGALLDSSTQTEVAEECDSSEEEISEDASPGEMMNQMMGIHGTARIKDATEEESLFEKIKEMCIQHLLHMIFGSKYEEIFPDEGVISQEASGGEYITTTAIISELTAYTETEETSFSTEGCVITSDGRRIEFDVNLTMSRSLSRYCEEHHIDSFTYYDPLVINLDVPSAELSDQNFYFDLDCDGTEDKIAQLCDGSGFLALDENEDGIINDGSELFGTKSGDGFADLAKYDKDYNGWIDEGDEVFERLKIWTKDADGNDKLYTLKEAGVGAIYLGNTDTAFTLTSGKDNISTGQIRSTGIFLYESGLAGTIQHVDLALMA